MPKLALTCALICSEAAFGALVQPIVPNVVPDRFRSLPLENQRLAGVLANRLQANANGFLEHADVRRLTEAYEETASSSARARDAHPQLPGRFLQAAANAYEDRVDSNLRKVMDQVADRLQKAQQPDGYLGPGGAAQKGSAAEYVAERANLLGLLAYYRVTGEEGAYSAAQRIGDRLVKLLSDPKSLGEGSAELGAAVSALIEPLVELHRYTAEPSYLELAKAISRSHTQEAEAETAPSPESLQRLAGLTQLYRFTADRLLLQSVLKQWDRLDHLPDLAGRPISDGAERVSNCVIAEWLKLTLNLFQITGQPNLGDALERTIYNQLFAAQNGVNGNLCSSTPAEGKKPFLDPRAASSSMCAVALADAIAAVPRAVWAQWNTGIAVNLYSAGRGTFQLRRRALVQVYVEGSYPEQGDVLLHVEPSRPVRFPLRLRVPGWSDHFTADFGRSHLIGTGGEFLTIDRQWQKGDVVKISIGMRSVAVHSAGHIAVQRGPQLLAFERSLNPQIQELHQLSLSSIPDDWKLSAVENRLSAPLSGEEAYRCRASYDGSHTSITLLPFSQATDFVVWFKESASTKLPASPSSATSGRILGTVPIGIEQP